MTGGSPRRPDLANRRPPRRRRLPAVGAAVAGFACLSLVLSTGVGVTDASWTASASTEATVTAARVGPVEALSCADSSNALLGLGQDTVRLSWRRPAGLPPETSIGYDLRWVRGSGGGAGSATVTDTEYDLKPGTSVLDLTTIRVTITPRVGSWSGPTTGQEVSATSALGLNVRVACGKLLGIL